MTYPKNALTKTIISPDWFGGVINLYTPGTSAAEAPGAPVANPKYQINVSTALADAGFPGVIGNPNVCALFGQDLYFTNDSSDSQAICRIKNYLSAGNQGTASVIDFNGNGYVGLAFDPSGNLYSGVAPTDINGPYQITQYLGVATAAGTVTGTPLNLVGYANASAFFGNLVFDALGNLWASDYANNQIVVIAQAALSNPGNVTAWVALANTAAGGPPGLSLKVATTTPGLNANAVGLLFGPEGLDFDGFGGTGNLWVANNNDGNTGIGQNPSTSLVQITPGLQNTLVGRLTTNPGTTVYASAFVANTDFRIFQFPVYNNAYDNSPPQFGGLQVDKAANRLYVNDETGLWVRGFDIATLASVANSATDTTSQIVPLTRNPNAAQEFASGNGGIALLQLGCYIQHYSGDPGLEPDTGAIGNEWESLSIVASIDNVANPTVLPAPAQDVSLGLGFDGTDIIEGGAGPRYVYVRVDYTSAMPTSGLEQVNVYWGKASATLAWPTPWDGSDGVDPVAGLPLGQPIPAATPFTIRSVVGTAFGKIPAPFIAGPFIWETPPDPSKYQSQDGHFCLLARIVTPNSRYAESTNTDPSLPTDTSIGNFAGMTVPESTNLNANVDANARIAWRNIHLLSPAQAAALGDSGSGPFIRIPPAVVANNRGLVPLHLRVGFTLLDEQREVIREPGGLFLVSATGHSLAVLERSSLGKLPRVDARRKEYRRATVPHPATGITGLRLEPRERLTFHVDYEPPEGLCHYAIRASAYAQQPDGSERLVGGQTFVYGVVAGFSTPHHHKSW